MDSPDIPSPTVKRENQIQGPRPTPLRISKDSHKSKKPPVAPNPCHPHAPPLPLPATMDASEISSIGESRAKLCVQNSCPTPPQGTKDSLFQIKTILHPKEARVIYANKSEFRSTVQRPTGRSKEVTDGNTSILTFEGEMNAYKDMFNCMMFMRGKEISGNISWDCLDCLVYCSLFPKDYEIDQDTLVQLWMAEGLVTEEPMEDIASVYLTALSENRSFISFLREDYGTGKMWYKVNAFEPLEHILEMSRISPVRVVSDDPISVLSATVKTEPTHVLLRHLPLRDVEALGRITQMKTLLLLSERKSNVERIPHDFFILLRHLHTLNLSRTQVSELPISIGNATRLRYLDLSETLIKRLPETIEFLQNLQTLKLCNCPRLVALPKATVRLTSLRHLDLGTHCRLRSMPPEMGNLVHLRTLSEFIVGLEDGCSIGELKNMRHLGGKICLSRLENVESLDDAREANLSSKLRLKKLELRWTDETHQERSKVDHKGIEYLEPPSGLEDLRILCYGGSTFPIWISSLSFIELTRITLFKCENCQLLPSLGQLPSLESLSLIELNGVSIIDARFRRIPPFSTEQFVAFPMLQKLEIKSMLTLEEWRDMGKSDFPHLTKFLIKDCPKLAALCKLSNALEYLEINRCTKLADLLKGDLPSSLKTLVIEGCPSLTLSCPMENAQDWHRTEHSPDLLIYQRAEEE